MQEWIGNITAQIIDGFSCPICSCPICGNVMMAQNYSLNCSPDSTVVVSLTLLSEVPLSSQSQSQITFNGEIFNCIEEDNIRKSLT